MANGLRNWAQSKMAGGGPPKPGGGMPPRPGGAPPGPPGAKPPGPPGMPPHAPPPPHAAPPGGKPPLFAQVASAQLPPDQAAWAQQGGTDQNRPDQPPPWATDDGAWQQALHAVTKDWATYQEPWAVVANVYAHVAELQAKADGADAAGPPAANPPSPAGPPPGQP